MPQDFTWDAETPTAPASGGSSFSWDDEKAPAWTAGNQAAAEKAAADAKASNYGQSTQEPAWQRMGEGIVSGAKAMLPSLPHSFGEYAREQASLIPGYGPALNAVKNIENYEQQRKSGQGVIPSVAATVGSNVGLDVPGIQERAKKGDVAGVIGEGIPAVASVFLPEAGKGAAAARERIGSAIHTPAGELTPMAHGAARAGAFGLGALAGKAIGIPGVGDWIAGSSLERAGPGMVEKLFPEPAVTRQAREAAAAKANVIPELGSPENPGWHVKIPERMPNIRGAEEAAPGQAYSAAPRRGIPTINDLGKMIEQSVGTPPLQRNVPISAQIPAKFPEVGQVPLGNRVGMDVRDVNGMRMNAPEKIPTIPQEEIGKQMGAPPLRGDVPLRGQFKPMGEAGPVQSEQARLESKFPDKAMRQMVHANGEAMVDAVGDDPQTLRAVHDLTNPDVRQAMINSGEDMGQKMVNNRKASGDMTRQEAFSRLLKKGLTPQQIIELAKKPMVEAKPGPIRAATHSESVRQAGD